MENLILGFATALNLINVLWCLLGVTLGTFIGILPGLGPVAMISLLLPYTQAFNDPTTVIIFIAGVYYGSQYGGSTTAILFKIPGESSSTVTILDGHSFTRKGRSGAALTIVAMSSFIGGIISILMMSILAEPLSKLVLLFGPAEYASLMILGIFASITLTQGNIFKGILMIVLGGFLGMIGTNITTGKTRFTADIIHMVDGIPFVVLAIGVFGIAEIIYQMCLKNKNNKIKISSLYPSSAEMRETVGPALRGSLIGSLIGLIPGGATALSSFFGYSFEKYISKNPKKFGKGVVAGIASPEAANNASAQTNFLPTLILGLPFTPIMGLIFAILIMNGIRPGPDLLTSNGGLFWGLLASMFIGNLILLIFNIPLVHFWAKILMIPKYFLYPGILLICVFSVYDLRNSIFDIFLLGIFGLLGFFLRVMKFELVPLVLSFIITPLLEEYTMRALAISEGTFAIFFNKWISLIFLSFTTLLLIIRFFYKK